MPVLFTFSNDNNKYYAAAQSGNTEKFLIGIRTNYLGNYGLFNITVNNNYVYVADNYAGQYGFWAYFISPTANCESSGSFFCLNTYDRAQFTFGFMQYAAHVPNGDFVKYLRRLLQLPLAPEYFPKLKLVNNYIHYCDSYGVLTQLENDTSTQGLMNYLNPGLIDIEYQEQITAARFIHWVMNDEEHRKLQIAVAIEHFKANMAEYCNQYMLNGVPDKVCLVICDIRHQGRASSAQIIQAMNTSGDYNKAFNNLLNLGIAHYPERIRTLKNSITKLVNLGILGIKVYNQSSGEFV